MNHELDEKLCKNFPLLYKDRRGGIQSTGMYFGFQHGDGWFQIIWDLSQKLEVMIQDYISKYPNNCECGHDKSEHNDIGTCQKVFEPGKWNTEAINCGCIKFCVSHPSASQIKEKYGTLRFYITSSSKEMQDEISKAEKLSSVTCENCGAPGVRNDEGWIQTLCKPCNGEFDGNDVLKDMVNDTEI